mmetsp:Transcript_25558/g.75357  ORF Transcript_25558/g.75357 Transcript_25558/m.75357 type:complete len:340 (-) Transcript_25558:1814-2833(-)
MAASMVLSARDGRASDDPDRDGLLLFCSRAAMAASMASRAGGGRGAGGVGVGDGSGRGRGGSRAPFFLSSASAAASRGSILPVVGGDSVGFAGTSAGDAFLPSTATAAVFIAPKDITGSTGARRLEARSLVLSNLHPLSEGSTLTELLRRSRAVAAASRADKEMEGVGGTAGAPFPAFLTRVSFFIIELLSGAELACFAPFCGPNTIAKEGAFLCFLLFRFEAPSTCPAMASLVVFRVSPPFRSNARSDAFDLALTAMLDTDVTGGGAKAPSPPVSSNKLPDGFLSSPAIACCPFIDVGAATSVAATAPAAGAVLSAATAVLPARPFAAAAPAASLQAA